MVADYMTDTYSGPSDTEERKLWVASLGANVDKMGRQTIIHDRKGKGIPIFEARFVPWRSAEVSI